LFPIISGTSVGSDVGSCITEIYYVYTSLWLDDDNNNNNNNNNNNKMVCFGWSQVWIIGFFNRPNPSSRTMALVSTQLITEMSTRNLPVCKGRPACKADKHTAICEPIV
jgi:hypothetical protein